MISSWRQPRIWVNSCGVDSSIPLNIRLSLPMSEVPPRHASSESEISDVTVWGSSSIRGVIALFGDSSLGAGVGSDVASGAGVLAGNGVVAAPGPEVSVETVCGVSVGSAEGVAGLCNDAGPSAVAGTVATAPPGVGVVSPQASRAARITKATQRGNFSIVRPFP